jgi:hypothetical protein
MAVGFPVLLVKVWQRPRTGPAVRVLRFGRRPDGRLDAIRFSPIPVGVLTANNHVLPCLATCHRLSKFYFVSSQNGPGTAGF